MKNLILSVFFLLSLLSACKTPAQKGPKIWQVEFSSLTRGGRFERVAITPDSTFIRLESRNYQGENTAYAVKTSAENWQKIVKALENVPLKNIPDLKSPTMKRAYDGAMHSEIRVNAGPNLEPGHTFDDEEPHESLKPLMEAIRVIRNEVQGNKNGK